MDQQAPLQPGPGVGAAPQTSGMAISSLVLGISSFFCWVLTGLPAVILGIIALRRIKRSHGQLTGDGLAIAGIVTGAVSCFIVLPAIIAIQLPAVQAARETARRYASLNNMKQIALAILMHENVKKTLPSAGGGAEQGNQLSWRVRMLPFLEQQPLFDEFHLNEPWDSEHNRELISRMPDVFEDPNERLPPGETCYLAVTGPSTAFGDGASPTPVRDITDGISRTVMLVEADPDQAVIWTKPDDWQFDPNNPKRGLGKSRHGGFQAVFCDASARFITNDTDPATVRAMMTRDGGEQVDGFR